MFKSSRFFYLLIILFFVSGVVAIGYGLFHLLSVTEVPLCVQPIERQLSTSGGSFDLGEASESAELNDWWLSGYQLIEIAGAVVKPGVYRLVLDARMQDLIQAAEGFLADADQEYISQQINLAEKLEDGQRFYIPFQEEKELKQLEQEFCQLSDVRDSQIASDCVSLNNCSAEDLQQLNGIGEKRAEDIVKNRPFQQLDELVSKKLVPESVFKEIEELICL